MNNIVMENSFEDTIRLEKARKKVKEMKGFYKNLTSYVVVNVFIWILCIVNLKADESFFKWGTFSTAFFWGIGLFLHWVSTFKPGFWLDNKWEERKIQEYMDKERTQKQQWE